MQTLEDKVRETAEKEWNTDTTRFPPPPACHIICPKGIRRFHFSCLTCWERRYLTSKRANEKLRKYKKVILILESISGRSFVLPEHYKTYGLIVPINESGKCSFLKRILLKYLLTAAERITEW